MPFVQRTPSLLYYLNRRASAVAAKALAGTQRRGEKCGFSWMIPGRNGTEPSVATMAALPASPRLKSAWTMPIYSWLGPG